MILYTLCLPFLLYLVVFYSKLYSSKFSSEKKKIWDFCLFVFQDTVSGAALTVLELAL